MANLNVALVLKLVDQFSRPLTVARTGLGKLKKDVGSSGRSFAQGAKDTAAGFDLAKASQKSQASFSRAKAGVMGAFGSGLPFRKNGKIDLHAVDRLLQSTSKTSERVAILKRLIEAT